LVTGSSDPADANAQMPATSSEFERTLIAVALAVEAATDRLLVDRGTTTERLVAMDDALSREQDERRQLRQDLQGDSVALVASLSNSTQVALEATVAALDALEQRLLAERDAADRRLQALEQRQQVLQQEVARLDRFGQSLEQRVDAMGATHTRPAVQTTTKEPVGVDASVMADADAPIEPDEDAAAPLSPQCIEQLEKLLEQVDTLQPNAWQDWRRYAADTYELADWLVGTYLPPNTSLAVLSAIDQWLEALDDGAVRLILPQPKESIDPRLHDKVADGDSGQYRRAVIQLIRAGVRRGEQIKRRAEVVGSRS
jgi:hypothetical protein